jgi:hypothetical protein
MPQPPVLIDPDGTQWRRCRNADVRLVDGQVYVRVAPEACEPVLVGTRGVLVPRLAMTIEHQQLGALQGTIVDADGTLLATLFTGPSWPSDDAR